MFEWSFAFAGLLLNPPLDSYDSFCDGHTIIRRAEIAPSASALFRSAAAVRADTGSHAAASVVGGDALPYNNGYAPLPPSLSAVDWAVIAEMRLERGVKIVGREPNSGDEESPPAGADSARLGRNVEGGSGSARVISISETDVYMGLRRRNNDRMDSARSGDLRLDSVRVPSGVSLSRIPSAVSVGTSATPPPASSPHGSAHSSNGSSSDRLRRTNSGSSSLMVPAVCRHCGQLICRSSAPSASPNSLHSSDSDPDPAMFAAHCAAFKPPSAGVSSSDTLPAEAVESSGIRQRHLSPSLPLAHQPLDTARVFAIRGRAPVAHRYVGVADSAVSGTRGGGGILRHYSPPQAEDYGVSRYMTIPMVEDVPITALNDRMLRDLLGGGGT